MLFLERIALQVASDDTEYVFKDEGCLSNMLHVFPIVHGQLVLICGGFQVVA